MIIDALLAATVFAATPAPDDDFWYSTPGLLSLQNYSSGDVTADSALQTTAVFACVRVLAETMAVLPFHVYETGGPAWPGSKRMTTYKVPTHRLRRVLQYEPNPWQTGFEFREMMMGHLALRGNAYAVIVPGPQGAIAQLIPKHPDRMEVLRLENGRLGYLYRPEKSLKAERYTQDQIFHVRGLSLDGMVGLSPVALSRHAIELAQQAEDHGLKFFKNMARPGGVLQMPENKILEGEEQHRTLRNSWREAHTGNDLFSVAILEDGMEWKQVGISNEDAQYADIRRLQVPEICRIFRVSPHMVGAAIEHGHTYANIEQSDLAFVKHTMAPWVVRWEQAIWRDLLVDQDRYTPKFSMEGLLRGDSAARKEFYKTMVEIGVWSQNDVLEKEDMNPFEGGDTHTIAAGRIGLTSAGLIVSAPANKQTESVPLALPEVVDAVAETVEADCQTTSLVEPWLADIAGRIAKVEIERLGKRVGHADEDREGFNEWVRSYWIGKHSAYVARTVAPLIEACSSDVTPDQVAETIGEQAVATFTVGDPAATLETWKEKRATQLTELLKEAIRNDKQSE